MQNYQVILGKIKSPLGTIQVIERYMNQRGLSPIMWTSLNQISQTSQNARPFLNLFFETHLFKQSTCTQILTINFFCDCILCFLCFFVCLFISLTYLMLFVWRHWVFFWPYRYYYNYHDHKYVEHDSPDERSPEDIGLLFYSD